jgi:CBS domain containing-hemolysin-like protein
VVTLLGWLAVILLIAATAFFVAAEFSMTSVNRAKAIRLAEQGDRRAASVVAAVRELSFQLSGAQLGITICSLLLGFVAEPVIAGALHGPFRATGIPQSAVEPAALVSALLLATVAQMLFGELLPQNLALSRPLSVARAIVPLQRGFTRACRPLITVFNDTANAIVRGLGVEPREELRAARTPSELAHLIGSSAEEGTLPATTAALLRRALSFGEKTAGDVMTPRVQMVTLQTNRTAEDVLTAARSTGRSRFPIHAGDRDDVLGVVHVNHAFTVPADRRALVQVSELMIDPVRVPKSLDCDALLGMLRQSGQELAVVVDEYGGTAGLVTTEDLVEEMLGQIRDEHDAGEVPQVLRLPSGGWSVSGQLHVDSLSEELGFDPPDGHYDTLAGLVLEQLGRVGRNDDQVKIDGWTLRVARVVGHRIDRVVVLPPPHSTHARGESD